MLDIRIRLFGKTQVQSILIYNCLLLGFHIFNNNQHSIASFFSCSRFSVEFITTNPWQSAEVLNSFHSILAWFHSTSIINLLVFNLCYWCLFVEKFYYLVGDLWFVFLIVHVNLYVYIYTYRCIRTSSWDMNLTSGFIEKKAPFKSFVE